jgi:hypothetical protein
MPGQTVLQIPTSISAPARPARPRPSPQTVTRSRNLHHALEPTLPHGSRRTSGCRSVWCVHARPKKYSNASRFARLWDIELRYPVPKSGYRVEARRLRNRDRFARATSLFAVFSGRILDATLRAQPDGELPRELLLQPIECRALYRRIRKTDRAPTRIPSSVAVLQ